MVTETSIMTSAAEWGGPGQAAPGHGLAQYAAQGSNHVNREKGDQDGGLHTEEGSSCYACGSEILAKHWVRRGPKGTRHDTCP